jgi:hypothetical protein
MGEKKTPPETKKEHRLAENFTVSQSKQRNFTEWDRETETQREALT